MENAELYFELLSRFSLCLEAFVLLCIACLFRAFIARTKGKNQLQLLTVQDNHAAAIDLCFFLLAVTFTLLDSFQIEGESLLRQSSQIALSGLSALLCLGVGQLLIDFIFFRGINPLKEIFEEANSAVAVARGLALISVSLMLRALLAHHHSWMDLMIWVGVGLTAVLILGAVFQLITPYDDIKELDKGNLAAAFPLGGAWLAAGCTVEAALYGESVSFRDELIAVALYLVIASIALLLVRWACQRLLLGGVDLSREITEDKNVGLGLFEATLYISLAEVTSFFLI